MAQKLTVKCYNNNATIFGADNSCEVYYDGDYCNGYTTDEYMNNVKDEILDCFGEVDNDSLNNVLDTIRIHVDGYCKE